MSWKKIIYPAPLHTGSTVGVTAPSSGVGPQHEARLNLALAHLKQRGFQHLEGQCLRGDRKSTSSAAIERANDFTRLWNNPSVDAIIPPWGGELLINILDEIDFEELARGKPKWILGYSDTSTLLFALTTLTGISTAHGMNLMDSILDNNDPLSSRTFDGLALTSGTRFEQRSSEAFQTQFEDFSKNINAKFNLAHKTEWKNLRGTGSVSISGRVIGGCLDTLRNLVGTPFGDIPKFASRFSDSQIILYLENAGSNPSEVCRALWQMRLAGWFQHVSGVCFGRSAGPDASQANELSYRDALEDAFTGFDFPVILDADIGHQPPQMTILNGSFAQLSYENGNAKLVQMLV